MKKFRGLTRPLNNLVETRPGAQECVEFYWTPNYHFQGLVLNTFWEIFEKLSFTVNIFFDKMQNNHKHFGQSFRLKCQILTPLREFSLIAFKSMPSVIL